MGRWWVPWPQKDLERLFGRPAEPITTDVIRNPYFRLSVEK